MITDSNLVINKEIHQDNGDVTWLPVSIDDVVGDAPYQVFNTFIGQYEKFETAELAKARYNELAQQIIEMHTPPAPTQQDMDTVAMREKLTSAGKDVSHTIIGLESQP